MHGGWEEQNRPAKSDLRISSPFSILFLRAAPPMNAGNPMLHNSLRQLFPPPAKNPVQCTDINKRKPPEELAQCQAWLLYFYGAAPDHSSAVEELLKPDPPCFPFSFFSKNVLKFSRSIHRKWTKLGVAPVRVNLISPLDLVPKNTTVSVWHGGRGGCGCVLLFYSGGVGGVGGAVRCQRTRQRSLFLSGHHSRKKR